MKEKTITAAILAFILVFCGIFCGRMFMIDCYSYEVELGAKRYLVQISHHTKTSMGPLYIHENSQLIAEKAYVCRHPEMMIEALKVWKWRKNIFVKDKYLYYLSEMGNSIARIEEDIRVDKLNDGFDDRVEEWNKIITFYDPNKYGSYKNLPDDYFLFDIFVK